MNSTGIRCPGAVCKPAFVSTGVGNVRVLMFCTQGSKLVCTDQTLSVCGSWLLRPAETVRMQVVLPPGVLVKVFAC